MKRFFTMIAILLLLTGMVGCAKTPETEAHQNNGTDGRGDYTQSMGKETQATTQREVISGEIIEASLFAEGLAFVVTDANPDMTHCINKKGEILFTLAQDISTPLGICEQFENGMVLVKQSDQGGTDYFCDTEGNITRPEDVGVTGFYDVALAEGYIIATVVTATFEATKMELGIMDLDFQWVVAPSEELYQNMEFSTALNSADFCGSGFVYADDSEKYMELSTGNLYDEMPDSLKGQSSLWALYSDYTYRDKAGNIMVDLSNQTNLWKRSGFVNGKAVLVFYNAQARKYYMTQIDEKGMFEYEPVELAIDFVATTMETDGQYVLLTDASWGRAAKAVCFDTQGNLCGMYQSESDQEKYIFELSDGTILKNDSSMYSDTYWYLNPDFTPLF